MAWLVRFHPDFVPEVGLLSASVRRELAAIVEVLKLFGPHMRRPGADTLAGSRKKK